MSYDTPYRPKDNTGSIFRNEKKEKDTHPDGTGSAVIDGVEYWVSSWNAVGKSGIQYRNLAFKRKDFAYQEPQQAPAPKTFKPASQDAFKARQLPSQDSRTADRSMPHKDAFGEDPFDPPF